MILEAERHLLRPWGHDAVHFYLYAKGFNVKSDENK